jgi:endonuclease/exonuclease/phosphatase family metal-dependent hydrolase
VSDILQRNSAGVLLRYPDPSVFRPHHVEQRPRVSDRRRCAVIKAERDLLMLRIITDHLELSDIARTRIDDALESFRVALEFKRRDYGMPKAEVAA